MSKYLHMFVAPYCINILIFVLTHTIIIIIVMCNHCSYTSRQSEQEL